MHLDQFSRRRTSAQDVRHLDMVGYFVGDQPVHLRLLLSTEQAMILGLRSG
jgi:hypothetical protein